MDESWLRHWNAEKVAWAFTSACSLPNSGECFYQGRCVLDGECFSAKRRHRTKGAFVDLGAGRVLYHEGAKVELHYAPRLRQYVRYHLRIGTVLVANGPMYCGRRLGPMNVLVELDDGTRIVVPNRNLKPWDGRKKPRQSQLSLEV